MKTPRTFKVYSTRQEMHEDRLSTSTQINNILMAKQVSRRKKLIIQGDSELTRKNVVRRRLQKKLEERKKKSKS